MLGPFRRIARARREAAKQQRLVEDARRAAKHGADLANTAALDLIESNQRAKAFIVNQVMRLRAVAPDDDRIDMVFRAMVQDLKGVQPPP